MGKKKIVICDLCCTREVEKNNTDNWCVRCKTAFRDGWLDDDLYEKAKTMKRGKNWTQLKDLRLGPDRREYDYTQYIPERRVNLKDRRKIAGCCVL